MRQAHLVSGFTHLLEGEGDAGVVDGVLRCNTQE